MSSLRWDETVPVWASRGNRKRHYLAAFFLPSFLPNVLPNVLPTVLTTMPTPSELVSSTQDLQAACRAAYLAACAAGHPDPPAAARAVWDAAAAGGHVIHLTSTPEPDDDDDDESEDPVAPTPAAAPAVWTPMPYAYKERLSPTRYRFNTQTRVLYELVETDVAVEDEEWTEMRLTFTEGRFLEFRAENPEFFVELSLGDDGNVAEFAEGDGIEYRYCDPSHIKTFTTEDID